jgi:chromate transporter
MDTQQPPRRLPPASLFGAFFRAGLMGFGGVLPMIRHVVVEERRWQTAAEFSELIALCQFLPGANVANFAVIFGARAAGPGGSLAALAGLMIAPVLLVLILVRLYDSYGGLPPVRHLVAGLSAGAAGLILATAVKIALPLRGSPRGMLIAAAAFAAFGLLRLPFLPSLCALACLSIGLAAAAMRR